MASTCPLEAFVRMEGLTVEIYQIEEGELQRVFTEPGVGDGGAWRGGPVRLLRSMPMLLSRFRFELIACRPEEGFGDLSYNRNQPSGRPYTTICCYLRRDRSVASCRSPRQYFEDPKPFGPKRKPENGNQKPGTLLACCREDPRASPRIESSHLVSNIIKKS